MADLAKLTSTLMSRVQLKTPEQESDLIYQIPEGVIQDIIIDSIAVHNSNYTIINIPIAEVPFAMWLAEIEILYMLATGNARFFKIKGQGAELNKQDRVKNYMDIIRGIERKYDKTWARFTKLNPMQIEVSEVIIRTPHLVDRAYRLLSRPAISISIDARTKNELDISWQGDDKSNSKITVYLLEGSGVIVDEYETPCWDSLEGYIPVNRNAVELFSTYDAKKKKYRIKELIANKEYIVAVVIQAESGLWSSAEISVTADAEPAPPEEPEEPEVI